MEPVDPRMDGLLDGAGTGGPDELRSIVARAARFRARFAAVAAGVAMAAGGGIGYGVASATSGGSGQQIVATAPVSGSSGAAAGPLSANGSAFTGSSIVSPASKFQSLFTRQVGSIDIRGFVVSEPNPMPYQGAVACAMGGPSFEAEVSTPHMVGIVPGFSDQATTAGAIQYTQPSVIGQLEGDPVVVVVAETATDVALVKMNFSGGSLDQMAPVQGWSAFAAPIPGGAARSFTVYGTMTAFDHAGKLLETVSVPQPKPTPGASGSGSAGSSGSGSVGTGSVGAGSVGTGSTGSGSVHAAGGGATGPPTTVSGTPAVSPPAQEGIVYPCKTVPSPLPRPTCTPPTTVTGANYACATPLPAQMCTASPAPSGTAGASTSCAPKAVPPATSGTTVSPTSGSGG